MIYTCTLNPAVDYRMELDHYEKHGLNRAEHTSFSPGGKGINVSIVLKNLGRDSIIFGFEGGFAGRILKDHLKRMFGLRPAFIHISDQTRVNVKIKEEANTKETEVNGPPPEVCDTHYEALLNLIETLGEDDLLVLAGSDVSKRFNSYVAIAEICRKNNVPFIVDSEQENVTAILKHGPLLLKPNLTELEKIENRALDHERDIIDAAKRLIDQGAKYVIVSMGGNGSYFVSEKRTYHAKALDGVVVNTVGAGDSMVAGFIDGYINGHDPLEAYKKSVAADSATAFCQGLADKKSIDALLGSVEIKEVE